MFKINPSASLVIKWQSNNFRMSIALGRLGLTCHKWKADTIKLKGICEADNLNEGVGEANDTDERVGEADNPNEVVGETDDPEEGVGEADDPDEGVGEADDPDVALLSLHVCIY